MVHDKNLKCLSNRKTFITGLNPTDIAITADGHFGYITNSNNFSIVGSDTITVLDLKKGLKLCTISDPSFNQPYRIAIDHKSIYAYVCNSGSPAKIGQQGTVTIIDTRTNTVCGTINGFDGPGAIVLSKTKAYVTNYGANGGLTSGYGKTVSVIDLSTRKIIKTIEVDLAPSALAINGKFLYVICYVDGIEGNGTLNIIKRKNNKIISTISGFFGPFNVTISSKYNCAYVSNFGSNNFAPYGTTVSVVDLKLNKIIKNIEVGIQPASIAISPNNDNLYVSNYNALYADPNFKNLTNGEGTINIICLEKNIVKSPVITVGQTPDTLVISPNGKELYVCNYSQNTVTSIQLK